MSADDKPKLKSIKDADEREPYFPEAGLLGMPPEPYTPSTDEVLVERHSVESSHEDYGIGRFFSPDAIETLIESVRAEARAEGESDEVARLRKHLRVSLDDQKFIAGQRDSARAERDGLAADLAAADAKLAEISSLVMDALANADNSEVGWDAQMSASVLGAILDHLDAYDTDA